MRDPPDSAVFEGEIYRGKRSSVYPIEVSRVPKTLRAGPTHDDTASAGSSTTKKFVERFVPTLIRALAPWPT
jgi:hypothetical protein